MKSPRPVTCENPHRVTRTPSPSPPAGRSVSRCAAESAGGVRLDLRRHTITDDGDARLRSLRQPHLGSPGGSHRRTRGGHGPHLRLRDGRGVRNRRTRAARRDRGDPAQLLSRRRGRFDQRAAPTLDGSPGDVADTAEVLQRPKAPTWSGSSRRPIRRSRSPICPRRRRAAGHGPISWSTTRSPRRCCSGHSSPRPTSVLHSGTKLIAGHSDVLLGAVGDPRGRTPRRSPAGRHSPDCRRCPRVRWRPTWPSAGCAPCRCGWPRPRRAPRCSPSGWLAHPAVCADPISRAAGRSRP